MVTQEQRRRQLAREKFLRQQQRRTDARRKARMRNAVIASVLGVVLVGSLALYTTGTLRGDDDNVAKSAEASPSAEPAKKAPDPCEKPAAGKIEKMTFDKEPALKIDTSAQYTMTLDTTCGEMSVELDAKGAPHTVNSFEFLAGKGYFDHTRCHRLTTQGIYVLQCGDPTAQGSGGPGYEIKDENLKSDALKKDVYPTGTVAMANAGPNTNGSQFFLVYQDSPLPPNYTPFGKLDKKGLAVLEKIAKAGESTGMGDGAPNATVVINKATVTKS
ncbi:peptidylprolyl isomerase [Streptomyces sp. NPDC005012]|uniref:peptidylprolyl isomerase n=1 Tax=Streptomyces sp. NPDC005012 TaxID=3154558 RepID=UPI0033ADA100